jgi:hypothetical protein
MCAQPVGQYGDGCPQSYWKIQIYNKLAQGRILWGIQRVQFGIIRACHTLLLYALWAINPWLD